MGRARERPLPSSYTITGDVIARYHANRLRVVRQVRYSLANENCIDLVAIPPGRHTLYAIPLKIQAESGAPARVFAIVED